MIPILVYDKDQCDPKKCTAKRMEKFGLAREVRLDRIPRGALVLDPTADTMLSPADAKHAHLGLVVLDLTWTHISELPRIRAARGRCLPYLVAANPVNWGKPWRLNSAEAVLASLIIMGMDEQAELFMGRFNWALELVTLNKALFDEYRTAADADEVRSMSDSYVRSVAGDGGGDRCPQDVRGLVFNIARA